MGNSCSKNDVSEFTPRNPNASKHPCMVAPRQYKPARVLGENISNHYATEYYHDKPLPPVPLRLPPPNVRKYDTNQKPVQAPQPSLPKSGKRWRDSELVNRARQGDIGRNNYHAQLIGGYAACSRKSEVEIYDRKWFQPSKSPPSPRKHTIPRKPVGEAPKPRKDMFERKAKGESEYSLFPRQRDEDKYAPPKKHLPVGDRPKTPYPRTNTTTSTSSSSSKKNFYDANANTKQAGFESGSAIFRPLFHDNSDGFLPPRHRSKYENRALPPPPPPPLPLTKGKGKEKEKAIRPSGVGGGIFRPRDSDAESYFVGSSGTRWS